MGFNDNNLLYNLNNGFVNGMPVSHRPVDTSKVHVETPGERAVAARLQRREMGEQAYSEMKAKEDTERVNKEIEATSHTPVGDFLMGVQSGARDLGHRVFDTLGQGINSIAWGADQLAGFIPGKQGRTDFQDLLKLTGQTLDPMRYYSWAVSDKHAHPWSDENHGAEDVMTPSQADGINLGLGLVGTFLGGKAGSSLMGKSNSALRGYDASTIGTYGNKAANAAADMEVNASRAAGTGGASVAPQTKPKYVGNERWNRIFEDYLNPYLQKMGAEITYRFNHTPWKTDKQNYDTGYIDDLDDWYKTKKPSSDEVVDNLHPQKGEWSRERYLNLQTLVSNWIKEKSKYIPRKHINAEGKITNGAYQTLYDIKEFFNSKDYQKRFKEFQAEHPDITEAEFRQIMNEASDKLDIYTGANTKRLNLFGEKAVRKGDPILGNVKKPFVMFNNLVHSKFTPLQKWITRNTLLHEINHALHNGAYGSSRTNYIIDARNAYNQKIIDYVIKNFSTDYFKNLKGAKADWYRTYFLNPREVQSNIAPIQLEANKAGWSSKQAMRLMNTDYSRNNLLQLFGEDGVAYLTDHIFKRGGKLIKRNINPKK